jgi:molybdopterin/thiamine biosynthesis adenylyltransferase
VGQPKAISGKETLALINPDIDVRTVCERADASTLAGLIADATVVLDCTDNFKTRHAINQACVSARVPLVSGAAIRMDGQVAVFDSRSGKTPCYACLFPPDQQFEEVQCSTMGVFAPLVGIIGTVQAAEALKLIMDIGESLATRLLLLDARSMEWTSIRTTRSSDCPVCADAQH